MPKSLSQNQSPILDEDDKFMIELVKRHVAMLVPQVEKEATDGGQVVLLTGATGSLGAHILSNLLSSPLVDRVVCLSRAKSHDESLLRVKVSVQTRRLQIPQVKWDKVVSYAADLNDEGGKCGLSESEWEGLKEVSVVIHNAWSTDFTAPFSSYVPFISGSTHLLNFARSTGASFFFSSSVATRQASPLSLIPEEFPQDVGETLKTGYGRSKWVTEKMMEKAGRRVGVFRLGQLVGDTKDGVWIETQSWPMMMKTAIVLGVLPLVYGDVSFLPVDFAGRSITEIALGSLCEPTVYHIIQPGPTSWNDVVIPGLRAAGLKFEAVDAEQWLEKLRKSENGVQNPARKLLGFYEKRFEPGSRALTIKFDTTNTCKVSNELASAPVVSIELVGKWVEHWKRIGFM